MQNELLISEPSGDANKLPLIHQGHYLCVRACVCVAVHCTAMQRETLAIILTGVRIRKIFIFCVFFSIVARKQKPYIIFSVSSELQIHIVTATYIITLHANIIIKKEATFYNWITFLSDSILLIWTKLTNHFIYHNLDTSLTNLTNTYANLSLFVKRTLWLRLWSAEVRLVALMTVRPLFFVSHGLKPP